MHPSKPWTVPVTQLSRREFFSITLASFFVQKAAPPAPRGPRIPTTLPHIASHDPTGERAWLGAGEECPDCRGLG